MGRVGGCTSQVGAKGSTMKYLLAAVVAASVVVSVPAAAQSTKKNTEPLGGKIPTSGPIIIKDLQAQLYLERSGKFSGNIVGTGKNFHNTVIGEGDAGEPADSVMVTIVFEGTKNTRASDKVASALAQVKISQTGKQGKKILLNKAYGGMLFGENGLAHKAILVDNATCAPLEIEAKIGRSSKTATINFSCGE
jgi:hypothetical protein